MYATTLTNQPLKIDQNQARQHLEYLGHKSDDNVFLRFFYHSDDPRKNNDKGRKCNRLDWAQIERHQTDGRGVYVVVNGSDGGHEDKDITKCAAIFCEWDDRPIEEQLLHSETVGFLEPTFTIYSGDKSAQPYWVLDTPITVEQWKELQRLLILVMGADPANKNPSRVFRLAGGWHVKPGREPKRTQIVQESGQKYSYQELKDKLTAIAKPSSATPLLGNGEPIPEHRFPPTQARHEDISLPVPQAVPIEVCLAKESRNLLQSGQANGSRNCSGAALARDLIGTANYLRSIGQAFEGDQWQLFTDYCHRCPPGNGWGESEWQSIWKSAQSNNPSPSCKAEGVNTCVKAWYWNNHIKHNQPGRDRISNANAISKSNRSDSTGGIPHTIVAVSLQDRIVEILNRNHSSSERKAAFIELAGSSRQQLREIEQLSVAIESEIDLIDGRADRTKELESLRQINERRLTISKYLHPDLAEPLKQLAAWMGVDAEALLTVLLPTSASLLHPETRVIVKECIDFREPMVFYTGIVSESGNRKSPTFKTITKGLQRLQNDEETRYKQAKEQYEDDMQAWNRDKLEDKGEAPKSPGSLREYFVDNITSEALNHIKSQQPTHGLLIRKDELSGLFSSYGAYKGGKGSDKEGILSGWNGDGIKVNRASGSRLSLSHDASSIAGAIQPGKLRKVMGDLEDDQGEWGRFLWYYAPLRLYKLPEDDSRFEMGNLLEGIFRKLDNLAPVQYRFNPESQQVYDAWHWELEQRKIKEPRQGMRSAIAKMQGYTARIAGILHILWATAAGIVPENHIPLERVRAARQLAEFYLGQVQLIHSDGEAAMGELTPILAKILEKAQGLGSITARTAKRSFFALKNTSSQQLRDYFNELVVMGHGSIEGNGSRTKFIPNPLNQSVNGSVNGFNKLESIDNNGLGGFNSTSVNVVNGFCNSQAENQSKGAMESNTIGALKITPDICIDCIDNIDNIDNSVESLTDNDEVPLTLSSTVPLTVCNSAEKPIVSSGAVITPDICIDNTDNIDNSAESLTDNGKIPLTLSSTVPLTIDNSAEKPIVRSFKVGDRVFREDCPGSYVRANPFTIMAIEGDYARLDLIETSVPLTDLSLAQKVYD